MFCIGMDVQRRPPSRLLICRSMAEKKNQTSGYGRTPRPYPSSTPQNLGYGRTPECGVRPYPELKAPEQWGYGRTPPPEPSAGGTAVGVRSSGTATRCGRRPSVRGGTAVTHFWQRAPGTFNKKTPPSRRVTLRSVMARSADSSPVNATLSSWRSILTGRATDMDVELLLSPSEVTADDALSGGRLLSVKSS